MVDLHIDQLIDTTAGLSNADMLRYQIDEFRKVMDANRRHHGMKIVFIHGKGEGVLRQAVLDDLRRPLSSVSGAGCVVSRVRIRSHSSHGVLMILYFSGTGNSRYVARELARHLGEPEPVGMVTAPDAIDARGRRCDMGFSYIFLGRSSCCGEVHAADRYIGQRASLDGMYMWR